MADEPFDSAWAVLKGMTGDQDPRVQAHRGNIPYAPEFDSPFRRQRPIRGEQPRGRNAPVREIQDVYSTGGANARRIRAQNRAGEPVYQPPNPESLMSPAELAHRKAKMDALDAKAQEYASRFDQGPMQVVDAQPYPEEQMRAQIEAANAEARRRLQAQQAPKISNYMADSAESMVRNNPIANLAHPSGQLPGVPLPDTEPLDLSMESLRENQE
jgi:hypothetical protein